MGRILVADLISHDQHIVIIGVYGFPLSHSQHTTNDDLITQVPSWVGRQRVCVMVTGDYNETLNSIHVLSASREVNMSRVSPDTPSTLTKQGYESKHLPLDHAYVNEALRQRVLPSEFRSDLPISDHLPLVTKLSIS